MYCNNDKFMLIKMVSTTSELINYQVIHIDSKRVVYDTDLHKHKVDQLQDALEFINRANLCYDVAIKSKGWVS